MRNAAPRRPHRERGQLASRTKWGLLEKHKDYSLRAKDYNKKKAKIAQLSQKARERNPDEFAFGMISQGKAGLGKHRSGKGVGDEDGKDKDAGGRPLSHDAVKLLKTQDANYLRTTLAQGRKDLQRVRIEVGMDDVMLPGAKGTVGGKKRVFDDEEAQPRTEIQLKTTRGTKRKAGGEVVEEEDEVQTAVLYPDLAQLEQQELEILSAIDNDDGDEVLPAAQSKPKPKSKKALAAEQDAATRLRAERKRRKRLQEMRVAKLDALKRRQREIIAAADQLDLQRAKMARSVGGVNKNGVKFKVRERRK